eukprot:9490315-Pyramimonas_sp.AAC.1
MSMAVNSAVLGGVLPLRPTLASKRATRAHPASKRTSRHALVNQAIRVITHKKQAQRMTFKTQAVANKASNDAAKGKEVKGIPYTALTIGIPTESYPGERRVAASPAVVATYIKKGFKVKVESGAGEYHR